MTQSPIADITLISESQSNKAITINEAIYKIEALAIGVVTSRTLTTPPGSPANGAIYIPDTGSTGLWSGKTNKIAQWLNSAWRFYDPFLHQRIPSVVDGGDIEWDGTTWNVVAGTISGDMTKAAYDTDNDGIVDLAENIDGTPGNNKYYGTNGTGTKGFYDLTAGSTNFLALTDTPDSYVGQDGKILQVSGNVLVFASPVYRDRLTGDRSYYVSSTGSDSNNGLSAGSAFATPQKAADVIGDLDIGINNVFVNIADGTYNIGQLLLKTPVGYGQVVFQGNPSNNTGVVLQSSGSGTYKGFIELNTTGRFKLKNLRVNHSLKTFGGSWSVVIYAVNSGAFIELDGIRFGATSSTGFRHHILSDFNASIYISSSYDINGGSDNHLNARNGGVIYLEDNVVITASGSPAFNNFVNVSSTGLVAGFQTTFSGNWNITNKYTVSGNGVLNTFNGNYVNFPGSGASVSSGGQVI